MNWTHNPYPVALWDTPGLPPRTMDERCARHKHCAYRDDDPARCPICHAQKCNGKHGDSPYGGWSKRIASPLHSTLKAGQYQNPLDEVKRRSPLAQPRQATCLAVLTP